MIIREIERPALRDLAGISRRDPAGRHASPGKDILHDIRFTGSGKGSLALVLKYLSERKLLQSKLDEVLVADWIGYWVYNQIQPFAFPVKHPTARTKIMLVYHQYGFPQDMDIIMDFAHRNKLVLIEDCAHAVASQYKERPLGTFGDFAIYSFSKWVFCFALGGVKAASEDFHRFSHTVIADSPWAATVIKDTAKFLSEWSLFSSSIPFKRCASLFLNMSYAIYGDALKPGSLAVHLLKSKLNREIELRQRRYLSFRKQFDHTGICDHLEDRGITPYVIPIRCSESKNAAILHSFRDKGIVSGLYNFDMRRNFLDPSFIQCIWVPCHSGISEDLFQSMIEIILKKI